MSKRLAVKATSIPTPDAEVTVTDDTPTLPRWRQPSSFATRKAKADADLAIRARRRMVSLGETEFTQRNNKTGEVEVLAAELFCDIDKPMDRFIEIDGIAGRHALHSSDPSSRDQVRLLPPPKSRRLGGMSNLTTPAVVEPPPRSV